MNPVLDHNEDFLPIHAADLDPVLANNKRQKVIHRMGMIASAKYISTNDHPYTGLFTGANLGFIRVSTVAVPAVPFIGTTPTFAAKFFRNGVPSGNLFANLNT